jgi:teichuronic acid biosynthesis glycosyltransferase TuaC
MASHIINSKTADKTLLVLSPDFPNEDNQYIGGSFVKNQLEPMKKYFKKIVVIAPKLFSGGVLSVDKLCQDYSYDNVAVYYPYSVFYPRCLPPKSLNGHKVVLDSRAHTVERLIRKENIDFDIIHAHFTWPSAYIAARLKENYEIPTVVTVHEDSGWLSEELKDGHPRIQFAWESADALIRVNKKDIPKLRTYNGRTYAIPNGYSPNFQPKDKLRCRKELNLPQDKKTIFSIGSLIERKGFNFLIAAMEEVNEHNQNVMCYIGGSGPLKDTLQRQIQDLQLADCVKLVGYVPGGLLPVWMNASDLFVLPSLNEGNPTVMFECLGCGKPFVGTDVGGVREIITSDDYGLLVRPGSVQDLAENLLIALDRDWDNEKIASYAQQYSWENIAKKVVWIYNEFL